MSVIETITFPDAVAVCCLYGQAALIAGGDLTTVVNSRVTNDERQVTLELTDSDIHDRVVQTSTIRAEVRTGDGPLAKEEAQDLGQLIRGLFGAMEGTVQAGATIYKVRDVQGFADSPDDRNGKARFTFLFSVAMRGGATLSPSTAVSVPDWFHGTPGPPGAAGAPGADGSDGAPGSPGVGVPVGGTTGQVLAKASNTDFDDEWVDGSGLPSQWSEGANGDVVATVDDPTKTPFTIQALVGQLAALLNLKDENGATAAITGGLTPWGDTGLVVFDPTASTPFEKGWIGIGVNPAQDIDGNKEMDLVLSYGNGSGNSTELWTGPRNGQGGFDVTTRTAEQAASSLGGTARAASAAAAGEASISASFRPTYGASGGLGADGAASVGTRTGDTALFVKASPGQTNPVLDVRDNADNKLLSVVQSLAAQNAIIWVTKEFIGGNPIDADAGSYTVQTLTQGGGDFGVAVIAVGDNQAAVQGAFDAIASGEFLIAGDWSGFSIEFIGSNAATDQRIFFTNSLSVVANSLTLLGVPVADPLLIDQRIGQSARNGFLISNAQSLPDVADLQVGDHGSISDPTAGNPTITMFLKDDAGNLRTAIVPLT